MELIILDCMAKCLEWVKETPAQTILWILLAAIIVLVIAFIAIVAFLTAFTIQQFKNRKRNKGHYIEECYPYPNNKGKLSQRNREKGNERKEPDSNTLSATPATDSKEKVTAIPVTTSDPKKEGKAEATATPQPAAEKPATKQKVYFERNTENIFLHFSTTPENKTLFVGTETSPGKCEFTLISAQRGGSWNLYGAVESAGGAIPNEASGFETVSPGTAKKKTENGTTYWLITKPARVKYTK